MSIERAPQIARSQWRSRSLLKRQTRAQGFTPAPRSIGAMDGW
jgi:hypothetical protein